MISHCCRCLSLHYEKTTRTHPTNLPTSGKSRHFRRHDSLWVNFIQCKTNGVAGRTRQSISSKCPFNVIHSLHYVYHWSSFIFSVRSSRPSWRNWTRLWPWIISLWRIISLWSEPLGRHNISIVYLWNIQLESYDVLHYTMLTLTLTLTLFIDRWYY